MSDGIQPMAMVLIPAAVALGAAGRAYLAHRRSRVLWSAGDPVEWRVLADVAAREAARRLEREIRPEHLLLAATHDAQVAAAFAARGVDVASIEAAAAWNEPEAVYEHDELGGRVPPSAAAAEIVRASRARAAGRAPTPTDLVAALATARASWAGRVLAAFGIGADFGPVAGDRDAPAPGALPPYRNGQALSEAAVTFWDDGTARLERIAGVLRTHFGLGIMRADHVVITASHRGSALVGVYPPDDVDALVANAVADANERDLPLRLTVAPAAAPPPRVGLRIGDGVDFAVTLAWQHAAQQHHRAVDAPHLLHGLLCDPASMSLWTRAGGDANALVTALAAHLAPASPLSASPVPSAAFGDALLDAIASATSARRDAVEDTDLLAAIIANPAAPWLRALIAEQRITADAILAAAQAPDDVQGADTRVVFHDDDETKMELVSHILGTVFEKAKPEADYLTIRVHYTGRAIVGTYARDTAEAKVKEALAVARDAGAPLCITTEDRPSASPGAA